MSIHRHSQWIYHGLLMALKKNSIFFTVLTFSLLVNGCVYKMDIQQGNEITPEMVAQLEIGMTKREVTRAIGTPLISDPFHNNRWDYYHSIMDGKTGKVISQQISLMFTDDILSAINNE